ncbi:hypothetical protein CFI00_09420 [Nocardioides sp. S5]|uniref:hypothetical protein n=1 Tax=Nocardioides sp. S5 TaxID=2017486 RepID=UPI001A8DACD4|nr:hypothetical protein [Nocardioides sp. S5]QSR30706.1 hypothetical protein CFI00_09420 [Nocardioides sp. S5]
MKKRPAASAAIVVLVATAFLGSRIVWVHDAYGEWGISPASPPLRISTFGRDYDRSRLKPVTTALPGLRSVDSTEHGTVLASDSATTSSPTVVYLEDPEGLVWSCALVGGP